MLQFCFVSINITCAFEPNTLTSAFQWCGCAFPAHIGSTMQMQGRKQYGDVPHIWPSTHGMSSSYHLGSPMLRSHPSIERGLQPHFLSICDTLFQYVLWWTRPSPLLLYRRTYGRQSPVIVHANFFIHLPEQKCSPLLHWPPAKICDRPFNLPHTFLYPGLDYCGIYQLAARPCPSNISSL